MKRGKQLSGPLIASLVVGQQLLSAQPGLAQQGQPYVKTFTINATQSGGFNIKARVTPAGNGNAQPTPMQGDNTGRTVPEPLSSLPNQQQPDANQQQTNQQPNPPLPANPAQQAASVQQVQDIFNQMTQQIAQQQQQMINQLTAAQQAQTNQLNNSLNQIRQQQNQAVQAANQQLQQQNQNLQNIQGQLRAQQNFMARAFNQFQQDRMLRNFERQLIANPAAFGLIGNNLGALGGRDLLWLVRDLIQSASNMANRQQPQQYQQPFNFTQGGQPGGQLDPNARVAQAQPMPTAEEIAYKLQNLMGDKLSEDAARKVMEALQKSTELASTKSSKDDMDRFAKISDRLDSSVLASADTSSGDKGSFAFDPDDYEQLKRLADNVGADDSKSKKEFLELSLEAAGRVGSSKTATADARKKARDFALELSVQFHDLKNNVNRSGEADGTMIADLEYDIEKCMRVSSGKDFYA
jgi:hypothetical protein